MGNWFGKRQRASFFALALALCALLLGGTLALAATAVQDDGNLFSAGARSTAEQRISQLQRDTGKSVTVRTVASLGGKDINTVTEQTFQQLKLNGVLIFSSKDDHKLAVLVGSDTSKEISASERDSIRTLMTQRFQTNDFDGGLLAGIDRISNDIRANAPRTTGTGTGQTAPAANKSSGIPAWLPLLIIVALIGGAIYFFTSRRNRANQSYGGTGTGNYPNDPNYGPGPNQGYGGGYNQGGNYPQQGGGGFGRSAAGGLAGGIGGAILGNAIYDEIRGHNRDNNDNQGNGGNVSNGDYGPDYGNDNGQFTSPPADGDFGGGGDSGVSSGDFGGGDVSSGDFGGGGDSSST